MPVGHDGAINGRATGGTDEKAIVRQLPVRIVNNVVGSRPGCRLHELDLGPGTDIETAGPVDLGHAAALVDRQSLGIGRPAARDQHRGPVQIDRPGGIDDTLLVHRQGRQSHHPVPSHVDAAALNDTIAIDHLIVGYRAVQRNCVAQRIAAGYRLRLHQQAAQIRVIRCGQNDLSTSREDRFTTATALDQSKVFDSFWRNQHHFAASRRGDLCSRIDQDKAGLETGGRPCPRELQAIPLGRRKPVVHQAVHHGVGHAQRRSHQATDVHLRPVAEQDAVLVDQVNLAVGRQLSQNLRRIVVPDTVQDAGRRIRLIEGHRSATTDIEAVPVQTQGPACRIDRHCATHRRRHGCRTGKDKRSRSRRNRQLHRRHGHQRRRRQGQIATGHCHPENHGRYPLARTLLAASAHTLRHRHPGVALDIEDQPIDSVVHV